MSMDNRRSGQEIDYNKLLEWCLAHQQRMQFQVQDCEEALLELDDAMKLLPQITPQLSYDAAVEQEGQASDLRFSLENLRDQLKLRVNGADNLIVKCMNKLQTRP